jgi:gas vesicle protein
MNTVLIILGVIAIAVIAIIILQKKGIIGDRDGDYIPDAVEDGAKTVKDTAKEVKRRAKRVKEEVGDVVDELKEAIEQVKDVKDAASGKPRRGRKPKAKK